MPESVTLRLAADDPVTGSCYRRLSFQGVRSFKIWTLTLYLSPDGRYLTSDLLDTALDPVEDDRRKAQALMASISENKGASLGLAHAPVTIVEFSDFECPYCRRFAEMLKEVLPSEKQNVRIVFHHLPLSMHPWARKAAEGAACAQLQNGSAFWAMEEKLFESQGSITLDNVGAKLDEIAGSIKALDLSTFRACQSEQMSLGLVLRDINLASSYQINATPTTFINGHRLQGVESAARLRYLIAEAVKQMP